MRAAGIRWRDYDRFMQKYVKRIGDERLTKVPANLDLKPYRDEHDYDLVWRMLASTARGQGPQGIKAKDVCCVERSAIPVPFLRKDLSLVAPGGRYPEIWAGAGGNQHWRPVERWAS